LSCDVDLRLADEDPAVSVAPNKCDVPKAREVILFNILHIKDQIAVASSRAIMVRVGIAHELKDLFKVNENQLLTSQQEISETHLTNIKNQLSNKKFNFVLFEYFLS
jgi:phosphopantetheinyl transferase